MHGRDLLLQHLGKTIGDGETTNLWSDSWIHPETGLKPYGPILLQDRDLMVSDILSRETKEWNRLRIEKLMPELTTHILAIRPSLLGAHDAYVWPLNKSGSYTVKSGYFASSAVNSTSMTRLGLENWNWKKYFWNPPLLPKLKFFLWKVLHKAISTGDNLQKSGVLTNKLCPRCGNVETQDHLFFHCHFAQELWNLGPWITPFSPSLDATIANTLQASYHSKALPPYGIIGNAFPWICWYLWTSRNKLIYELHLHRR